MKKILALVVLLIIFAPIAYITWEKEWLVSTPASVFQDSLAKANAGKYEDASQNIYMLDRGGLLKDHKLMKDVWDKVTKNGTIRSVEAKSDNRDMEVLRGCTFVITYQDGSKLSGHVPGAYDRRWHHGIRDLYEKIVTDEFDSATISLSKEYTRIENTGIYLRLPVDAVWNAKEKGFEIPKTGISIVSIDSPREITVAGLEKWAEHQLLKPGHTPIERQKISNDGVKATLFEADIVTEKNRRRRMYLVLGDKKQAAVLYASMPKQEWYIATVRECLSSARWEPENKKQ